LQTIATHAKSLEELVVIADQLTPEDIADTKFASKSLRTLILDAFISSEALQRLATIGLSVDELVLYNSEGISKETLESLEQSPTFGVKRLTLYSSLLDVPIKREMMTKYPRIVFPDIDTFSTLFSYYFLSFCSHIWTKPFEPPYHRRKCQSGGLQIL
jgi:hypothetical protein